jgi:hypothetical protein
MGFGSSDKAMDLKLAINGEEEDLVIRGQTGNHQMASALCTIEKNWKRCNVPQMLRQLRQPLE